MSTLHAFSTDAFPYTVGYVSELLGLNDADLAHYAKVLGIGQQQDERTGKLIFFHKDVELLKRAVELVKSGESLEHVASRLMPNHAGGANQKQALPQSPIPQQPQYPQQSGHSQQSPSQPMRFQMSELQPSPYSPDNFPGNQPAASSNDVTVSPPPKPMQTQSSSHGPSSALSTNRDALAMMVETVSQVKEGILKDLSRMLDDKLSGLDEVVVQLIRAQSENESLKKRLDELHHRNQELEQELTSFKPVQFGFYKKTR